MKVYDCFPFFNELDLLKIRLETLKELDPIHVLVEATTTHTGLPKPLYFEENKELFKDYNIRHIITELPNNGDYWLAENKQRDAIIAGLYDAEDEDLIIISDLDEIARPDRIRLFDVHIVAGLKMDKYSYYINCLEGAQCWEVPKLTTFAHLKTTTPNKLRNGGHDTIILDAGWHMSFLGGVAKMREKLFSYAHTETVTADLLNNLERKFERGESMWGTDLWRFVRVDETFPKVVQENKQFYEQIGLLKKL
jgi:beta-1,4-mannosyl-glycoprotein beta-1,4-N-acetylglucosaminyltransferase